VGEETEQEARRAGFTDVKSAEGANPSLAELVMETCAPSKGPLLYLAGERRKPELEIELAEQGYRVEPWEIYGMRPSLSLKNETLEALQQKKINAVLLFSNYASMHFLQLAQALDPESLQAPVYICLSKQVALPLLEKSLTALYSSKPVQSALIELLMQKIH
jgi:uroporphyrinogen-III synthase